MLKIVIAFSVGALFGMVIMCCLAAAGRADREMELDRLRKENIDDGADGQIVLFAQILGLMVSAIFV